MLALHAFQILAACGFVYAQTLSTSPSSGSSSSAVQLYIDNMDPNAQWAASIQNACSGSTTYVVSCTSAPYNNACSPQTATITEGSDFFIVTTPAIYSETSVTVTESCHLDTAKSSASCEATIVAGGYGHDISTTIAYNLTGTNYYEYNVQITAGADHTAHGGACAAKGSNAYSTRFGTGMQSVKVVGSAMLVGVAAVLVL